MMYTITIQPGNHQFTAEKDENLLEAALKRGLHLPYGCRNGFCGNCKATLVSGEVAYDGDVPALQHEPEQTVMVCQARIRSDLVIEGRVIGDNAVPQPVMLPVKVVAREQLCHDVLKIMLKLPESKRIPFLAGQYLDIITRTGEHRSFSIANAPHNDELIELHIRHVDGGEYTSFIFDDLKVNDLLRIEIPLGGFCLQEDSSRPVVLMGGGTGFAPLKGIIEHARHINHNVPIHLFWGVRAKRDLYMDDLPRQWAEEMDNFSYTPVLSDPADEDNWNGATGLVHNTVMQAVPELAKYDVYMSGPPAMIEAATAAFATTGLPRSRMFSDAFEFNRLADTAQDPAQD